ncbi:MAG: sulfatase-like hydrolase/transferase [Verrucomicrobiota bacterium]
MNDRWRWIFLFSWLVLPLGALAEPPEGVRAENQRPNVIVIVADDLGFGDIGMHGCKDIPTPEIDAMARRGVSASSGYVSAPLCSPSRAGLLTGRYQNRFGHEFNPGGKVPENFGLRVGEVTIADYFRGAGYSTALIGKWHLGWKPAFHPLERGFTEFFGFLGGARPYLPGKQVVRFNRGREMVEEREYLTDAFKREALDFISRKKESPFFLYLSFNAVHTPLQATEAGENRFLQIEDRRRRTYAAMTSALDDAVGAVMSKLKMEGLEEKTLVFFISDNGGPIANGSSNGPLRGTKTTTWEGGIRVPWIMQWKGNIPSGKIFADPVIQLDILPTALAAAGIPLPVAAKVDGVNLLPYLRGERESAPHPALFWRFGKQTAVRKGDWNLVNADGSGGRRLFNLRDDIGQKKDLSGDRPEVVTELQLAWDEWNAGNIPPTWDGESGDN